MSWKNILKNIEFDPTESCCSELKNNFLELVEKISDYYESIGIYNNMRMHYTIADGSCEDVLNTLNIFLEGAKNPPEGSRLPSWAKGDIEKILDEYESCKDNTDKIKVPLLQKKYSDDTLVDNFDNIEDLVDSMIKNNIVNAKNLLPNILKNIKSGKIKEGKEKEYLKRCRKYITRKHGYRKQWDKLVESGKF